LHPLLQINSGQVAQAEQLLDSAGALHLLLQAILCRSKHTAHTILLHGFLLLQINSGQVAQAEQLLDNILKSNPSDLSALVARGTARALARKLQEAVADFSKAIEIEPR
jgi:Flp pilus assembly protein TadD